MRRLSRAFIVGLCMLATLPAAAQAITLQAERGLTLRGDFVKRSGSVLLNGRATVSKTLRTKALLRVQVRARGRTCRGRPLMRISLDGRTVALAKVGSSGWRTYGGAKAVRKGRHKVVVRFSNPRRTRTCRRQLAVDRVLLTERKTPPAKPPPPPPPPASGAQAVPPGHYLNPVYTGPVGGGFADPMILDAGDTQDDYWAYATGGLFNVAHSTDLVHWTDEGSAMTSRPSWTDQTGEWNPWAPSVIERPEACPGEAEPEEGEEPAAGPCYVMFFVSVNRNVTPNANCIGVATSATPGGPFTDQGILEDADESRDSSDRPLGCGDDDGYSNIDPAPFVDTDGTPFLYFSTGHRCPQPAVPNAVCDWDRQLSVVELAPDLLSAVGARQAVMGNDPSWEQGVVENPWMNPTGGDYELIYSGGNFSRAYGMGYATNDAPGGLFAKSAGNPLLQDSSQVRSAGGGMLLTGPKGAALVAYHGRQGAYSQPRTLRIDRLGRTAGGDLHTGAPSSTPQPNP